MARRSYAGGAVPTTLAVLLDSTSLSATVAAFTLWPSGAGGNFVVTLGRGTATEEKILCSATSGVALTIVSRGYDGTTGVAHSIGTVVEHTIAAIDLDEANAHVNASTAVHGLGGGDGSVVGTTKVQTLTGKTIDGDVNTFVDIPRTASPQLQADIAAETAARTAADLALLPPGSVIMYGGAAAPTGYLICDGSAVSRATYAALFTAIGSTHGPGDGTTTFNLPALSGRVPRASGGGYTAGQTPGGADTHVLLSGNLPAHAHDLANHTHGLNAHTHDYTHAHGASGSTSDSAGSHSHTATYKTVTYGTGSTDSYVRTSGSAGSTVGGTVGEPSGGHNHTVNVTVNSGGGNTGGNSSASATPSSNTSGNGPGSATAVDHRDPFAVLVFCIKT